MIIYTSVYGSTRSYAQELACRTGHVAVAAADCGPVSDDTVVLMGPVHGSKIADLPAMVALVPEHARLLVVSVGMSNPAHASVRESLTKGITSQLGGRDAELFFLRGAISYPGLKVAHKSILAMVKATMSAIPESKRDDAVRDFLATYGQTHDFRDNASLEPIIAAL